ncbi:MAG: acyl-[ACP]--phospholipid O-acyltransferase [Planctomycetaceae bacterium]
MPPADSVLTLTPPAENDPYLGLSTESSRHPQRRRTVRSPEFIALLVVQFLTVLNDHTFRWLVVPIAKPWMGKDNDAAALALGLALFTLPMLFLAMPSGYLADRFCKARVITNCKLAEMVILALGLLALSMQSVAGIFIVIACTGALAALFAPAKIGCIPEIVTDSQLATANGWMALLNVVPCALGFLLGNLLAGQVRPSGAETLSAVGMTIAASTVLSIAVLGWGASYLIPRVAAADPERPFDPNLLRDIVRGLGMLSKDVPLLRTAMGIAFFWMLASLAQLNVDQFVIHDLGLQQQATGMLGALLIVGVAIGSILAGRLSAGRIELGFVPLGALGMASCSLALYLVGSFDTLFPQQAVAGAGVALFCLGFSAGFFDVPLEAYLQFRSAAKSLGATLAATNFLMSLGVLLTAGLFWWMLGVMRLSPSMLFLIVGLSTIAVAAYIIVLLPGATIPMLFWLFSRVAYRLRVFGQENLPLTGGALLVPNHVTWIDGILLMVASPRPIRFVAYADLVENPKLNWLARVFQVIPIKSNGGPKALIQSLRTARQAVEDGHCVCIFPEGGLTRTGQTQPFRPGFLRIVDGTGAPVIPVYLHGLWGSIFSYRGGKFFWKLPRQWPYPVTMVIGKPITQPESVEQVSTAVRELSAAAVEFNKPRMLTPQRRMLRTLRRGWRMIKVSDSSGLSLTGGKLLIGILCLRRELLRSVLGPKEKAVGIFLPPTVACTVANLAVSFAGRVTVNLNYTLSGEDLQHCVQDAKLKHVLTSRKMLEKFPAKFDAEVIYLEDLKERITTWDKCLIALGAFALPASVLERLIGLTKLQPDDLNTIIFTSGSTGEPKGVMLTNYNVAGTCEAADQLFQIESTDCLLGILPIFHSFGYIGTLWLPLMYDASVTYHVNPLDARIVGELAKRRNVTILMATPTFLRSYLKRCDKEQFHKLDLVVVGAEKMPADLAEAFHDKFGVTPQEGYGATETSGPAAVNVPDHRCELVQQRGTKLGTVGRPLPGVVVRILDPDTRSPLPVNHEGLVEILGCNVMAGYLNHPEKTDKVLKDGWYNTGDMGLLDEEGFLRITGRLSRFSKIGGEMVPHIRIEECLAKIVSNPNETEDSQVQIAVTAVPDPKKGERLIVLHCALSKPIPQILDELSREGLPNLWLPSADGFAEVDHLPLLGSGKLDLKAIKQMALDRYCAPKSGPLDATADRS